MSATKAEHLDEHARLMALTPGSVEAILQTTRHLLEQHSPGIRVETEKIHQLIHVHEAWEDDAG